jgi:DNA-binding MarR family transcriptional regulator
MSLVEGRPTAAEALVATDIFEHAPTTVTEIVKRTGVLQSQVSTIAAELHESGVLERRPDPTDQRRTLLVVPARARKQFGTDRGRRGVDTALREHLAASGRPSNPEHVAEVVKLLDELAKRLEVERRLPSRRQ